MRKRILSLLIIIAVIAFLTAYYNQAIQVNPLDPAILYPKSINGVWPEPGSEVNFFSHLQRTIHSRVSNVPSAGGVSVSINPIELDTKENLIKDGDQIFSLYTDRTKLLIDGKEVPKDEFIALSGILGVQFLEDGNILNEEVIDAGPYSMSWYPVLWPGRHRAEIVIENRAGELEKYLWEFIVTLW